MNNGSSNYTPFYIETTIQITPFIVYRKGVTFLQSPVVPANNDQKFHLYAGGYGDPNDSLVYELIVPKAGKSIDVPNYVFPNQINGSGGLTIDHSTGMITWDSPKREGLYSLAVSVRRYVNIDGGMYFYDRTIRDFTIIVLYSAVNPSENLVINNKDSSGYFIQPGDTLTINYTVTGQNSQGIKQEAVSELFAENKNIQVVIDTSTAAISILKIKVIPDSSLFRKNPYVLNMRYQILNENASIFSKDTAIKIFVRDPKVNYITSAIDPFAKNTSEIMLFPNPACNQTYVVNNGHEQILFLYNIDNQLIKSINILKGTNPIDLNNLKAGVYFYKANSSSGKILKE